ncbi:MAG TPA: DNA methyltransferase [Pirellulales bacterium]|nr:DNA methyltransferase [Pirellulales bacterium]
MTDHARQCRSRVLFTGDEPGAASHSTENPATRVVCRLADVSLDATSISQDRLNIDGKVRSNLFPWNGQFSPQLVHVLLETYGRRGDIVLDPFMGSGTVLVEAARLRQRPFGAEINPAACKMAQTYAFMNDSVETRKETIKEIDEALVDALGFGPLFSALGEPGHEAGARQKLLNLWRRQGAGSRTGRLLETLIVLLDFYGPDVAMKRIFATWRKLSRQTLELPFTDEPVDFVNCDARHLPLGPEVVDLVTTSPPYINVFNYHQQYRASAEAMGWDLLHVAKSEIGANRKHRGNRFLTVIQYCLDMCQVLAEMRRVCKPSARIILVVGRESNVRKTPFYNGDIVVRIGTRCAALSAESRQERVFKNKFGRLIYEDILHFRRADEARAENEAPGAIAKEVLTEALDYCPVESEEDLHDSLRRAAEVKPSAVYFRLNTDAHQRHETAHASS